MSDDDSWGSGSDNEDDDEQAALVGQGNVWQKHQVSIHPDSVKKNHGKSVDVVKEKEKTDFASGFGYNVCKVYSKLYPKLCLGKQNAIVPVFPIFLKFSGKEEFENAFDLDDMKVPRLQLQKEIELTQTDVKVKTKWKYRFKKIVKTQKFRKLGVLSSHGGKACTMMCNEGTQELFGEHNWNNQKFNSLTLPLAVDGYTMLLVKPLTNTIDGMKGLEKSILVEGVNMVGMIKKEQENRKMEAVMLPVTTISIKTDVGVHLKRVGFLKMNKMVVLENVEFCSDGTFTPQAAPLKKKETYVFFKSEVGRTLQNVRECRFVLDSPFLFFLVEEKNQAPLVLGKVMEV